MMLGLLTSAAVSGAPASESIRLRVLSLGAGVRYQSLIGPIRLEYGHNLNPRPKDPRGTLLFSLGFPF